MTNSIWHTKDERPEAKIVFVEFSTKRNGNHFYVGLPSLRENVVRWCYLDKLLEFPDRVECLEKELDYMRQAKIEADEISDQFCGLNKFINQHAKDTIENNMRRLSRIDELEKENAELKKALKESDKALSMFIDDHPCVYDHHGYCQTHFDGHKPCVMVIARKTQQKIKKLIDKK